MVALSRIFFFLNLFLFILFFALSLAKYSCYPQTWTSLLKNPVTSLYIGCFPMGATTLISVAVQLFHDRDRIGGEHLIYFLWAMWWLDVVLSILCCWVGVHMMYARFFVQKTTFGAYID